MASGKLSGRCEGLMLRFRHLQAAHTAGTLRAFQELCVYVASPAALSGVVGCSPAVRDVLTHHLACTDTEAPSSVTAMDQYATAIS